MTTSALSTGIQQLHLRVESSPGTSAASWQQIILHELATLDTATYELIAPPIGGHRHPLDITKPEKIQRCKENVLTFKMRPHRASTDGNQSILATLFQAAGWAVQTASVATTLTGTPSATSMELTADVGAVGMALLIERSSGVYVPVLAADYGSSMVTASMGLSAAPSNGAVVEVMHTMSPVSSTGYQVPSDATLQFRMNTGDQYDDALGDMAHFLTNCGVASIGGFSVGKIGDYPVFEIKIHGCPSDMTADDIAADAYQDSSRFPVNNNLMEAGWATASSSGGIANATVPVEKVDVDLGVDVMPVYCQGTGQVGGVQCYVLKPKSPTVTITTPWIDNSAFEEDWLTQLEGDNASKYFHVLQPTTDLDVPALGVWMPNCHIQEGGEPKIEHAAEMSKITATFVGDLAGYNSETAVTEYGSAPIIFATSSEAA
jgi:hypothetical protein